MSVSLHTVDAYAGIPDSAPQRYVRHDEQRCAPGNGPDTAAPEDGAVKRDHRGRAGQHHRRHLSAQAAVNATKSAQLKPIDVPGRMPIESLVADVLVGAAPACIPGILIPGSVSIATHAVAAMARTT